LLLETLKPLRRLNQREGESFRVSSHISIKKKRDKNTPTKSGKGREVSGKIERVAQVQFPGSTFRKWLTYRGLVYSPFYKNPNNQQMTQIRIIQGKPI